MFLPTRERHQTLAHAHRRVSGRDLPRMWFPTRFDTRKDKIAGLDGNVANLRLVPAFTFEGFMIQHKDDTRCCGSPAEAGGTLDALDCARAGDDAAHGQPVARPVRAGGLSVVGELLTSR